MTENIDKKNPTCYIFYRTMTFSKGKVCEKGVPWGAPFSYLYLEAKEIRIQKHS